MQPLIFTLGGPSRNMRLAGRRGVPPNFCGNRLLPALGATLSGVSRDSAGVALAGCTCTLFRVTESPNLSTGQGVPVFTQVAVTVSDGSGNYSFPVGFDGPYRVTFDLDGAPIRAGLTLKSLSGI